LPAILWLVDELIIAIVGLRPGLAPSVEVVVDAWDMSSVNDNADRI